ncbi:hypothetical protein [Pontivivens ytuae]|nr:hypothetical protein [Pontivivens ytuae]
MSTMLTAFAAMAVITVGAWYVLNDVVAYDGTGAYSNYSVRLD